MGNMNQVQCQWCNNKVLPVEVHGHSQCPYCKINIDPCCSGETIEDYDQVLNSCKTQRYDE